MPLVKSKSKKAVGDNIRELHQGGTHAKTERKFGKKKADKQSVAIALDTQRRAGGRKSRPRPQRKTGMRKDKGTGINYGGVDD